MGAHILTTTLPTPRHPHAPGRLGGRGHLGVRVTLACSQRTWSRSTGSGPSRSCLPTGNQLTCTITKNVSTKSASTPQPETRTAASTASDSSDSATPHTSRWLPGTGPPDTQYCVRCTDADARTRLSCPACAPTSERRPGVFPATRGAPLQGSQTAAWPGVCAVGTAGFGIPAVRSSMAAVTVRASSCIWSSVYQAWL